MIKYLEITNYQSINQEQVIDFELGIDENSKFKAQPVIGFAGSNASGKTNTLRVLGFLSKFVTQSFNNDILQQVLIKPFITKKENDTIIKVLFSLNQNDYFYELTVCTQHQNVSSEKLSLVKNEDEFLIVERNEEGTIFGNNITVIAPEIMQDIPQNCSVIAYLNKFKSQTEARLVYDYFTNLMFLEQEQISFLVRGYSISARALEDLLENHKSKLIRILKYADIGIIDVALKIPDEADDWEAQGIEATHVLDYFLKDGFTNISKKFDEDLKQIVFSHNINDEIVPFNIWNESSGTVQLVVLLDIILDKLENGGILIIDELEEKLHPDVVCFIIDLFNNPYENEKNAQLIFSFHNSQFMNNLKPEQLWFASKNKQGATDLYPASAFDFVKDLSSDELEKYYRAGRFGGKPSISYIPATTI